MSLGSGIGPQFLTLWDLGFSILFLWELGFYSNWDWVICYHWDLGFDEF